MRRIRERLAAQGLDWDLPPYPPPRTISSSGPLQCRVILDNHITDPDPRSASANNQAAWLLIIDPDAQPGDAERAVALAKRAVELAPTEGNCRNTLGAAYYRAGAWRKALAELTESMRLRHGGDSFDWFFLAMAHYRLDHREEAWQWFHRAVLWSEKHRPSDEELRRFREEAEALLGLRGQP